MGEAIFFGNAGEVQFANVGGVDHVAVGHLDADAVGGDSLVKERCIRGEEMAAAARVWDDEGWRGRRMCYGGASKC
jgi:hypothetical protein